MITDRIIEMHPKFVQFNQSEMNQLNSLFQNIMIQFKSIIEDEFINKIHSQMDANALAMMLTFTYSFHLIPSLIQQYHIEIPSSCHFILYHFMRMRFHQIDYSPILDLIPFGLDPTYLDDDITTSALSMMHDEIKSIDAIVSSTSSSSSSSSSSTSESRLSPSTSVRSNEEESKSDAASTESSMNVIPSPSIDVNTKGILDQFIECKWTPLKSDSNEYIQGKNRHHQFIRRFESSWLNHSHQVRSLLLSVDPSTLIPPLVDIIAECLGFSSLPRSKYSGSMEVASSSSSSSSSSFPSILN